MNTKFRAALPGDEQVPDPILAYTRAITIHAPVSTVWPWIVQIGQGRGGLYSYDFLENLVGCDMHSADQILPEHQDLKVGDIVRFGPPEKNFPGQKVLRIEPERALVMCGYDPTTGEIQDFATWTLTLEPIDEQTTNAC